MEQNQDKNYTEKANSENILEAARERINSIDAQMAALFEQRIAAVEDVLTYKRQNKLPVFDAERERQVIERNTERLKNHELSSYYRRYIQSLMDITKDWERACLKQNTVALAGAEGAFAWQAATGLFPDYRYELCESFAEVFAKVLDDTAVFGVIPFENSYSGEVGEVFDLLFRHPCHINAIWDLPICQNLLAQPNAKLSDIKTVVSHPQALSQCAPFLQAHGLAPQAYANTALAAQYVAALGDKSVAAIASKDSAELYGLNILAEGINSSSANTTRFIVIAKDLPQTGSRFNLLFTVNHNAGQLARVMSLIGDMGFNMESIKSRPMKDLPWQYYFYVEIEGSLGDSRTRELLEKLKSNCDTLKILGSYDIKQLYK